MLHLIGERSKRHRGDARKFQNVFEHMYDREVKLLRLAIEAFRGQLAVRCCPAAPRPDAVPGGQASWYLAAGQGR
jgi:hypothetical protein